MSRWRLDALLRVRREAEQRAGTAHGDARRALEAGQAARAELAAAVQRSRTRIAAPGEPLSAAELQAAVRLGRRLERAEGDARTLAAREHAALEVARATHLLAWRERLALDELRRRELERARRARGRAEEDELADRATSVQTARTR